jgi:riboflavin synthase
MNGLAESVAATGGHRSSAAAFMNDRDGRFGMFAGIIKGVGRVAAVEERGGDRRIVIDTRDVALGVIEPGASIAMNGVCLTATESDQESFAADVSGATLSATTLGVLAAGSPVNLEPSLRLGEPLDGHLVSGHVDGVGRVVEVRSDARSTILAIELPAGLARFVARKGSVAVDGVSLTVNAVDGARFEVNVIPATLERTIIGSYRAGSAVNIEVDIIARYLDRLRGEDG